MKHLRLGLPVFITLIAIGIVSTIIWFKSPIFGSWAKNQYFGEISDMDKYSITLTNKEQQKQIILFDTGTKILKGAHPTDSGQLRLHTPVIVIGETDGAGVIHAKAIRIFPQRAR